MLTNEHLARLKNALKKLDKEEHPELVLQVADEDFVLSPSEAVVVSQYVCNWLIDKSRVKNG